MNSSTDTSRSTRRTKRPVRPPLLVGLTGGIASGKSTVGALFAVLGVPVIDTDQVAREVVAPGSAVLQHIVARFGPAVLQADGSLDHDNALTGDDLIDYVNKQLFPYLQGFRQRATGPTPSNTRSAKSSARSKTASRAATACAMRWS